MAKSPVPSTSDQTESLNVKPCPFLQLPGEIRLLIFEICRNERQLVVVDGIDRDPIFNYGNSACRKLLQVNRQIRNEARQARLPPLSLRFTGRGVFCRFLACSWSVTADTSQRYIGSRLGLLVAEGTLHSVETICLAPGTTEVGYLSLSKLKTWLPNLRRLDLDLRKESMWLYNRDPKVTQKEILVKEIKWRLGTIFGVDANSLQQGQNWALSVHASFLLPANPDENTSEWKRTGINQLRVVSLCSSALGEY